MREACLNCRFFVPANPNNTFGFCKSGPPIFTHMEERDGRMQPKFNNPVVTPTNWCGDFDENEMERL